MNNFWKQLDKGFLALAPIAGFSDQPFRIMCKKNGADVTYSEMISSEAIWHNRIKIKNSFGLAPGGQISKIKNNVSLRDGLHKSLCLILFSEIERPYVVQIFGADPEHMGYVAEYIASGKWEKDYQLFSRHSCESGNPAILTRSPMLNYIRLEDDNLLIPDGIDINMGCPVRDVTSSGAGAALMKDDDRAVEIIRNIKKKVKNIPVSVKTRLGWERHDEILDFAKKMQGAGADAIAIHGRTKKEGFSGPVYWDMIEKVKKTLSITVVGNGGINSYDLWLKAYDYNLDGYMIGTGALGKPWIFGKIKSPFGLVQGGQKSKVKNKVSFRDDYTNINFIKKNILEHAKLYRDLKGDDFVEFRKQLVWYFTGLEGARKARKMAVRVEKFEDVVKLCEKL